MKINCSVSISIFLISILSLSLSLNAQDIENLVKSKAFRFSGNLYISGDSYANFGNTDLRRSPYSYSIIGSPVFSIYGISLPFSFAFSDQQYSFSQPFNIYGLSPNYKWATLHLGYRSMSFSPFTLSGKQFFGIGTELTPGKFRVGILYGKLKDLYAQKDTLALGTQLLDTYDRMIHGLKIGYGEKSRIDLSYIKVKDKENSSDIKRADNTLLFPEDNFVLGLNTNINLFKYLNLFLESSASLHTSNQKADLEIDDETVQKIIRSLDNIIEVNASTRWGFAGKTGLQFNYRNIGMGLSYLRVDPYFKSLGLYYMNTDYEIYSANSNFSFFKNQLRFTLTGGYQQNNISKLREQTDQRTIGSINVSYFTPKGFALLMNYSNYQTDQSAGYIQIVDSLKLALVNEMALLAPSYSWQKNKINHSVNMNITYQKFIDVNKFRDTRLVNDHNYNASMNYSIALQKLHLSMHAGGNYYLLISDGNENSQFGLNLGASKRFFQKKLHTSFSGSYNLNFYNQSQDGHTASFRIRSNYKIGKIQSISLNIYWLNRTGLHQRNINELRSSLNYNLSF